MNVFHHPPSSVRALALVMLVGVCFPALTAGCSRNAASSQLEDPDPVIEITSPEPGKIVNTTRVTIKGRAENVEEVDVNGTPASVVGGVFETKITLPEGAATVEVTAREVTDEVSFTIDVSPPVLELASPTRRAMRFHCRSVLAMACSAFMPPVSAAIRFSSSALWKAVAPG